MWEGNVGGNDGFSRAGWVFSSIFSLFFFFSGRVWSGFIEVCCSGHSFFLYRTWTNGYSSFLYTWNFSIWKSFFNGNSLIKGFSVSMKIKYIFMSLDEEGRIFRYDIINPRVHKALEGLRKDFASIWEKIWKM